MAILESTVDRDGGVIHHEVLEADYDGNTPDQEDLYFYSMHAIEKIMRNKEHLQVGTCTQNCFTLQLTI